MKINVKQIPLGGEDLEGVEPPEIMELNAQDVSFANPVAYWLHAQLQGHSLLVTGRLQTEATLQCGRCLRIFQQVLTVTRFVYLQELTGEDFVDLTPRIREDILLELPQRALCRPDCKGLCPQCGKDLNEGTCNCRIVREDLRWQALDQLKFS
ncbi:MAG: DUF177 domain-containing protein [Verrucomicrobiae bacterium]|nr:DUF177 domain-containing protein [Verrucomicrobiae bacterium]